MTRFRLLLSVVAITSLASLLRVAVVAEFPTADVAIAAEAADEDDKLGGAVEVEQLFIDFIANDHFAWRSFGVDVVPVGYINLFHEPTQYYSTNRPEIYDALIPSTWYAPSTSA